MAEDISSRITQAREAAEMSKSELARKMGVTPQSVYDWETGNTQPRGKRLNELAEALGVSVHWLAFGEEAPHAITTRDSAASGKQTLHDERQPSLPACHDFPGHRQL